jgi:hypothetical protein
MPQRRTGRLPKEAARAALHDWGDVTNYFMGA